MRLCLSQSSCGSCVVARGLYPTLAIAATLTGAGGRGLTERLDALRQWLRSGVRVELMRGCESGLHVVTDGNAELMYGVGVGVGGEGLRASGSAEGCVEFM